MASPPPVSSGAAPDSGSSSGDEVALGGGLSPGGGWRARAALKAARLRAQADSAMKAATESVETFDVSAKVNAAAVYNFVSTLMNFAFKMIDFVFKMMNFGRPPLQQRPRT